MIKQSLIDGYSAWDNCYKYTDSDSTIQLKSGKGFLLIKNNLKFKLNRIKIEKFNSKG